jgi:hypothetical protein
MRNATFALSSLLVLAAAFLVDCVAAFAPPMRYPQASFTQHRATALFGSSINVDDPELKAAIAQVRKCASSFSKETEHFANVWIDNILAGTNEKTPAGLLDECILDDDACNCEAFDAALKKLDSLVGVGANEQF